MWYTILFISLGVGAFWVIYMLFKHYNKVVGAILSLTPEIIGGVRKIADLFDKNPLEESPVEKMLKYAEIAATAVEQSYKTLKEEKKKALEDGKITEEEMTQLYAQMKEEAIAIVEDLARVDNFEITPQLRNILNYVIEAIVFFLPKSVA